MLQKYCRIQYSQQSIIFKFQSALFVNKSTVKWSEQRNKFLLMCSGTSLKRRLIHSLLMLDQKEGNAKTVFFHRQALIFFCGGGV